MKQKMLKLNMLCDTEMRKLGFQDYTEEDWVYVQKLEDKNIKRLNLNYSFNFFLKKDLSDYKLEVVNEDTGNIYNVLDFLFNENKQDIFTSEDSAIQKNVLNILHKFKNARLIDG